MRRSFVGLMFISLLFMGLLLYIQWFNYTKTAGETKPIGEAKLVQAITVTWEHKSLHVEQQVSGINGNSLNVRIPKGLNEFECVNSENKPCQIEGKRIDGEDSAKFQFRVPMEEKTFLFNQWVQFPEVKFKETTLEVIEPLPFEGFWTSTASLTGYTQLETIAYFQFQTNSDHYSLFRSEESLHTASIGPLQIFGSGKEGSFEKQEAEQWVQKLPEFGKWNIVFSDLIPASYTKGLLIVPSTTAKEELKASLIRTYMNETFIVDESLNESFLSLISSILLEEEIHPASVYPQLLKKLSERDLDLLQAKIKSQINQPITPSWLDEQLYKIKGLKTTFVTDYFENGKNGELLFFDPRPVTGFNNNETNILTLIQSGLRYFPLIETMDLIGYEVNQGPEENLVEIRKEGHHFQFYTDKPSIFENDVPYLLKQIPLSYFNNKLYMEEGWLRRLFTLDIITGEDTIRLKDLP